MDKMIQEAATKAIKDNKPNAEIPISFLTYYCESDTHFLEGNIESIPKGAEHIFVKTIPSNNPQSLYEDIFEIYGNSLRAIKDNISFDKQENVKLIKEITVNGVSQKWYEYFYYKDDFINTFSFSKAANICIEKASRKWMFILNADERVLIESKEIDMLNYLPEEIKGLFVKNITWVQSETKEELEEYPYGITTPVNQLRLFQKIKGIRYVDRVHEKISKKFIEEGHKTAVSNILIKHQGNHSKAEIIEKNFRNIPLMCQDLFQRIYKTKDGGYGYDKEIMERLYAGLVALKGAGYIPDRKL